MSLMIYYVTPARDRAKQVHPVVGAVLKSRDVLDELLSRGNATLQTCGEGKVQFKSRLNPNLVIKLPTAPASDLNQRIENQIDSWLPGEEVILLVETSSHLN